MKPTPKAPAIAALLSAMCGIDHNATIEADRCKICDGKAVKFKTDLSRREYAISGMCQACQDKVFDPNIQEY
jgi:hypothetical protein